MAKKSLPDPELLRKLLRYDPETGKLFWRKRPREMFVSDSAYKSWNTRFAEKEALKALSGHGYPHGSFQGTNLQAHRVGWAVYYGEWPSGEIDHINGNRSDNRITNLRCVTRSANSKNLKRPSDNTSGFIGVSKQGKKWRAYITDAGRYVCIGTFETKEIAAKARYDAAKQYGYHPNHGRE